MKVVGGSQPCSTRFRSCARAAGGVSLLEFAVSLPFLFLILAALIDMGVPLSNHETVLDAVRHVGETVAARSGSGAERQCSHWEFEGERMFQRYMGQANLNYKSWNFTANFETTVEGDLSVQTVRILAAADPNRNWCFLCSMGFAPFEIAAESSFRLQGSCIE